MILKYLGAGLILAGCGSCGFALVSRCRQEEHMLRMLLHALKWMEWELRYHLTPLPELCRLASFQTTGQIRCVLADLALTLDRQSAPDAACCMNTVLSQGGYIPSKIQNLLRMLGSSLGCFDLAGQLEGLQSVQAACMEELVAVHSGQEQRLRSYQTLSLCTGAALIIVLI